MNAITVAVLEALDRDFKDWLGEYEVVDRDTTDYHTCFWIKSNKGFAVKVPVYGFGEEEMPRRAWRAVAEVWLLAGGDEEHSRTDKFHYHDGSIRGIQNKNLPMPPCRSEKEMDIRYRLAFGKELG